MGKSYRKAAIPIPAPAEVLVRKPRARTRPKGAPTHVRSWPLRPDGAQCREIGLRFFTGVRVFNAVLDEFITRSRAVKADPAWQAARELPDRTAAERKGRGAAFRAVEQQHGFAVDAAQSFASSLRKSWVREHLPAQETQNLGARAFDAVRQWHVGRKGKPRFKSTKRGLHSLSGKDGNGALRPKTDAAGRLIGLQWGAGLVIPIAAPAATGRRGKEQQAELVEIEALIAAGRVLSTRIVRTVIDGRDTYRMQLVCDGRPTRRHPVGEGRVSFDLGPSQIAVAVEHADGSWSGWVEPLADAIRLDTTRLRRAQRQLDRQHRAGSPQCFNSDGTHTTGRCGWRQRSGAAQHTVVRVAELHRRLAEHRRTLHGALANRLIGHGGDISCEQLDYVSWQKNFPRSVRDRAPGLLVEMLRRKAESAGGQRLYEYNPRTTALSQTCLCGNRRKKPLSQRVHRCECGIHEDRDLFSAYLGLHVRTGVDGVDRLDLQTANTGWLHRQDVDESPKSSGRASARKRRGRRHPPSRRSVARINARRKAATMMRQSRSARTSTTGQPTAVAA
ncbi:putative transposase [Mycobacterium frederiksbergense]|uniref:Transposase n=1 Tax=Mycolicibacterium frederiksbergense TaxID=117567 RepID=A0ABT6KU77_9MYCO|nr:transposase [Mycolicibacterium frederiksbergense]MDH6194263.1 putative transposase [Mycolicibacterium frederiksbergense]